MFRLPRTRNDARQFKTSDKGSDQVMGELERFVEQLDTRIDHTK
jgi:hypothetical protein